MNPLEEKILELSKGKNLRDALEEWEVSQEATESFAHSARLTTESFEKPRCLCGHDIKRVFSARHILSNNVITPIGFVCMKHFKDFESSKFYKTFVSSQKIHCKDCGTDIINETAYKIHCNSTKHKKNIGSKPCEICESRVKFYVGYEPIWCFKCYKKWFKEKTKNMGKEQREQARYMTREQIEQY